MVHSDNRPEGNFRPTLSPERWMSAERLANSRGVRSVCLSQEFGWIFCRYTLDIYQMIQGNRTRMGLGRLLEDFTGSPQISLCLYELYTFLADNLADFKRGLWKSCEEKLLK